MMDRLFVTVLSLSLSGSLVMLPLLLFGSGQIAQIMVK